MSSRTADDDSQPGHGAQRLYACSAASGCACQACSGCDRTGGTAKARDRGGKLPRRQCRCLSKWQRQHRRRSRLQPPAKVAAAPAQPAQPIGPATAPPRSLNSAATVPPAAAKPAPAPCRACSRRTGRQWVGGAADRRLQIPGRRRYRLDDLQGQACARCCRAIRRMCSRPIWARRAPGIACGSRASPAGMSPRRLCDRLKADGGTCFLGKIACDHARSMAAAELTLSRGRARIFSRHAALGLHPVRRAISKHPIRCAPWSRALRETVGDATAPVLIDQEGGRVARLEAAPLARTSAGGPLRRPCTTSIRKRRGKRPISMPG